MASYIINGGNKLKGSIPVTGAKNSLLPILAAVLLNNKRVILHNCPRLVDVENMILILKAVGCHVKRENCTLVIDSSMVNNWVIPDKYVKETRSSIVFLGAMLARMKKAKITYPGGCEIGIRPINLHLKGLRRLGVIIDESGGYLSCEAPNMLGSEIQLDYPSVGATENIILAAAMAKGETIIRHAAKEPEIIDLQDFINAMGGKVSGAGTNTIRILGVNEFDPVEYTVLPDRIVAGTFLTAVANTGGDVLLTNVISEHVQSIISKLREAGCVIQISDNEIRIKSSQRLNAIEHTITSPYPGFPTDMQAQLMSVLATAKGTSIITEDVFENRYKHVSELMRMGANIKIDGKTAVIQGVKKLKGAKVIGGDLRGGAALVLAGLVAEGQTIVENVHHIDRGYDHLETSLRNIGADIKRV